MRLSLSSPNLGRRLESNHIGSNLQTDSNQSKDWQKLHWSKYLTKSQSKESWNILNQLPLNQAQDFKCSLAFNTNKPTYCVFEYYGMASLQRPCQIKSNQTNMIKSWVQKETLKLLLIIAIYTMIQSPALQLQAVHKRSLIPSKMSEHLKHATRIFHFICDSRNSCNKLCFVLQLQGRVLYALQSLALVVVSNCNLNVSNNCQTSILATAQLQSHW